MRFGALHGVVDNIFCKLCSEGVGSEVVHTPAITADEEKQLWKSSVLNITMPKGLQRAVFFLCGEIFVCVVGRSKETRTIKFLISEYAWL